MTLACLVTITPLHVPTGERVPVRVSSADDRRMAGLGGNVWEPAMVAPPVLGINLWNGDFTDAVSVAGATIPINMGTLKESYPFADDCYWTGAPVEILAEAIGTPWPWRTRFTGKITATSRKANTLSLTAEVDTEPFKANLLTATYAGTGGAEGPSSIKDQPKPLVLGWALNVEPLLIDADNSVYQFSAYGPIEAVSVLYERGSDFGASVADYATYAALVAAAIPRGRWGSCLAQGMVRLGAPAYGVITADLRGHRIGATTPRLTGKVIAALAGIAGVDADLLEQDSLDRLDLEAPYPVNLVITDQTRFLDMAQGLALACNAQAGVSFTGTFLVARVTLDAEPVLTLDAQGKAYPQVKDSEEAAVSAPYWKTTLGANRAWRVHTTDEVAFEAPIVERGRYDAATSYREGNWVSLSDGSEWLYIALTASTGNAPPTWPTTSNAWWQNKRPPTKAQDITFNTGVSVESLKPAEAAATNGAPIGTPVGTITAGDVSSTISSGGGVAPNQVGTSSIVNLAVTKTTYIALASGVTLTNLTDVDIFSLTVTKDQAGSLIRVEACVIMESSDDIRGDFTFYDSAGTTPQVYGVFMNGAGGTYRVPLTIIALFSGIAAGSNTYKLKFRRNGGASTVSAQTNSIFSVREEKK